MSEFVRNAKFWDLRFTKEFNEANEKTQKCIDRINSYIRNELVIGNITSIEKQGYVTLSHTHPFIQKYQLHEDGVCDDKRLTAAQYKNILNKECVENELDLFDSDAKAESPKRGVLRYCLERFAGYNKRNRKKNGECRVPNISNKRKNHYIKEGGIRLDEANKILTIPTMYGKYPIPYKYSIKEGLVPQGVGKWPGGNIKMDRNELIIMIKVDFDPLYIPEITCKPPQFEGNIVAYDLNKTPQDWIAFNDGTTISATEEIQQLCFDIKELQKELKEKDKAGSERKDRSPARRKKRSEWKKLHSRLNTKIEPIAEKIIVKAIESQSLLCLDSVKTGQKMGTFGQDHITPMLQTMCENLGVPFFVVPCGYTSQRCSKCGNTDPTSRLTTDKFKCVHCPHEESAHLNAAKNIAYQGSRLFQIEVEEGHYETHPYGNHSRYKVDTLIEKFIENYLKQKKEN